jgi:xanthine/uracil permease
MNRLQITVGVMLAGIAILLYLVGVPGRGMELPAFAGFALIAVAVTPREGWAPMGAWLERYASG